MKRRKAHLVYRAKPGTLFDKEPGHGIPAQKRGAMQRGGTILGLIFGMVIGLAAALAVAIYVTKVPVPFLNKGGNNTQRDAAEAERNKNWDPNAALQGKAAAKSASAASAASGASAATGSASGAAPGAPAGTQTAAAPAVAPSPAAAPPAHAAGARDRTPTRALRTSFARWNATAKLDRVWRLRARARSSMRSPPRR